MRPLPGVDQGRLADLVRWAERDELAAHGVLPFHQGIWVWIGLCLLVRVAFTLSALVTVSVMLGGMVHFAPQGSWWLLAVAALLAGGSSTGVWDYYRNVFHPTDRRLDWLDRVADEFHSWRVPPARFWPQTRRERSVLPLRLLDARHPALAWIRTPLHRWLLRGLARGNPRVPEETRWDWARWWARTQEIRHLPTYVAVVTVLFIVISLLLSRAGWIRVDGSLLRSRTEGLAAFLSSDPAVASGLVPLLEGAVLGFDTLRDYLWQIVDTIPLLGLSDVFWLDRPKTYGSDPVQSALVLLFRGLMFAPAIAYVVYLFRSQDRIVLRRPSSAGPVERAVVAVLHRRGLTTLPGDDAVLLEVGRSLGERDADAVVRALVSEQAST
ncbi:hypothetical protein SAMN05192558_11013 [Actinokineospora alba]|uniref:DUF2868 domain-containing protein n=1 Tax=Actinokineospora alba TaxID=504798 RepID=A0A1H0TJH1_9PSEU|nr:hypothetical protein [Actinokineospora alba]TDP70544.1 hypothetical protein C8E96_6163 [Actinokineospora alba]SDJ09571.1 hypothetical protein SAMN05421871_11013 [Actinokineospora alba]SDP53981.1 hypothetical protein SAMN05192558_11013 [Actinokineospora alba]